jgi:predicted DsbA family dithiol-disulfide isomerase
MKIAVFSDVICPWCLVGKRRLERALAQLGLRESVAVDWLPFELNPDMPPEGMERSAYRARKFGAERSAALDAQMTGLGREEGIAFAFDRQARTPNTRQAHRLIAHASSVSVGARVVEALFRAYFEEGKDIDDEQVLLDLAEACGIDREAAKAALHDEDTETFVVGAERRAAELGINGVPFFIVDGKWTISGAQPTAAWVEALQQTVAEGAGAAAS